MTDEAGLVRLLHRADWTRLSMSAVVSDGSTVLIAPGKRYRYQTAEYLTGCSGGRPWELSDDNDDDTGDGSVHWNQRARAAAAQVAVPVLAAEELQAGGAGAGPRLRARRPRCLDDEAAEHPGRNHLC